MLLRSLDTISSALTSEATERAGNLSFQVEPASLSMTLEALEYQRVKVGMLSDMEIAMIAKARANRQTEAH
jgi:hypothetical protein